MLSFPTHILSSCLLIVANASPGNLPSLSNLIDVSSIGVVGFSSGGFFAQQLYLSHSEIFSSMATLSGGPYLCANSTGSDKLCMFHPEMTNVQDILQKAEDLVAQGQIDNHASREKDLVYIWHGSNDATVLPENGANSAAFFRQFAPFSNLSVDTKVPANHGLSSPHVKGTQCGVENSYTFVENCTVSTIQRMLHHFYAKANNEASDNWTGDLAEYDQTEFLSLSESSFDSVGYFYVPSSCGDKLGFCKLLILLHGCTGGREYVGQDFIVDTGILPLADANNIIIVFPQIKRHPTFNPYGCWNYWGYVQGSPLYYTKLGKQVRILRKMITRVAGV